MRDPHMRNETPEGALPTKEDFNPWGGCLDALWAWKNFGGLTLEEATIKFRERPEVYQEDFMFIGGKAFAFYFPVVDTYLRSAPEEYDNDVCDDHEAWILAHCIKAQFERDTAHLVLHLKSRVIALSTFVRENIHRFAEDMKERQQILGAWAELGARLSSLQ